MPYHEDEELALMQGLLDTCLAAAAIIIDQKKRDAENRMKKMKRTLWTRQWILDRPLYGHYEQLMSQLQATDLRGYRGFTRLDPQLFQEIVDRVGPRIQKTDTFFRKALDPGLKIAVTLRYMATGESYRSLSFAFRVGHNTISLFVPQVCKAITEEYMGEVMKCPTTPEEWKMVAQGFADRWQWYNGCGAIDGKHIVIRAPPGSGSLFFSYKKTYSIVLMAVVDAHYRFVYIDVGAQGSSSDGGVFRDCDLFKAMEGQYAGFPEPETIPKDDKHIAYHLIGDDAFALRTWLMKPFPGLGRDVPERIFNYRLSRARRVVENAFGILSNRFRCFLTTMCPVSDNVETVVVAACVLHNLIAVRRPQQYMLEGDHEEEGGDVVKGIWRQGLANEKKWRGFDALPGNTSGKYGKLQREYLKEYYNNVGAVSWQKKAIGVMEEEEVEMQELEEL